jgi:ATP-dependent helicase/nuclease subunit B
VVENQDLIQALEHPTEDRFRFLPIDVTKGGYKATSALITAERMGKLVRRVEQTVLQLGRTLKEGCVEADPYRKDGDHTACDWCDFRAACMFDETMSRDTIRTLPGYGREEINEILDREEDDHGDQLHTAAAGGHKQSE